MILSDKHKIILVSPPKTGTRFRYRYYKSIQDILKNPAPHSTLSSACKYLHDHGHNTSAFKKVVFVRNPWRRSTSMFHMFHKCDTTQHKQKVFKNWMMSSIMKPMHHMYFDDEQNILADQLLKSDDECWVESHEQINTMIGFDAPNISYKPSTHWNTYKHWFDDELIEHIKHKENITIDLFNYTFD